MPLDLRAVLRGLALRCPACGKGKLYRSLLRIRDACPVCGYEFALQGGEFTGAMMLAQFLWGAIGLYGWFYLEYFTTASDAVKLGWAAGCIAVLPLATYRNIKGLWVGIARAGEAMFDEAP